MYACMMCVFPRRIRPTRFEGYCAIYSHMLPARDNIMLTSRLGETSISHDEAQQPGSPKLYVALRHRKSCAALRIAIPWNQDHTMKHNHPDHQSCMSHCVSYTMDFFPWGEWLMNSYWQGTLSLGILWDFHPLTNPTRGSEG